MRLAGIRPATRAATIEGMIEDEYLRREKKTLLPTERAFALKALLLRMDAQALLSPALTGEWEAQLAAIEGKELDPVRFRSGIELFTRELAGRGCARRYASLSHLLKMPDVDGKPGERAPRADDGGRIPGRSIRVPYAARRTAANGTFWGCTGYPAWRHTQPDNNEKPGERPSLADTTSRPVAPAAGVPAAGSKCPDCSKDTLQTRSLKGRTFIGCSSYPACRYFRWSA